MSRSYAMIRFKKTGNIYMGCYNGTSDILLPFICTPEECYDEKVDCYCSISYCQDIKDQRETWYLPDGVTDLDECEIYSDYGGGFYWSGVGSESAKMISEVLDPFEYCYEEMVFNRRPEWVDDFWKSVEEDSNA